MVYHEPWVALVAGAVIAIASAYFGVYFAAKRQERNELNQFYSWIISLLEDLSKARRDLKGKASGDAHGNEDFKNVIAGLTTQPLHYIFHRLYVQIPKTVNFKGEKEPLLVRDDIYKFLKSGDKLPSGILRDNEYWNKFFDDSESLRKWLLELSK